MNIGLQWLLVRGMQPVKRKEIGIKLFFFQSLGLKALLWAFVAQLPASCFLSLEMSVENLKAGLLQFFKQRVSVKERVKDCELKN